MKDLKPAQPPLFAEKILSLCIPNTIKDEILGDLEEEFNAHLIRFSNKKQARYNYWQQALVTLFQFIAIRSKDSLLSSNRQQIIVLILGFTIFIISLLLISWLSHLDGLGSFSQSMATALAQGNPHKALVQSQFWQISFTQIKYANNLAYFFQLEAFTWAVCSIFMISLLRKKQFTNKKYIRYLSLIIVFLPYTVGSIFLQFNHYPTPQVGLILAQMIFSVFYLTLPVTYFTFRNLSSRNNYE